jgi:hypothetical protein
MVMVKFGDKEFSIDGYHKENLDIAKEQILNDWDMLFVYDGAEGSGKSVKAMQDAYYCDPTFNIDRVVFTPNAFRKAIMGAKKYQAIVYDEAYTGLSSRATMSLINRTLIKMLAEIRQRNLFVFVLMPCFFDLDKYVALWRSRALVHIYTKENFERGYFAFFNNDTKKALYINGKKYYSYSRPKANFIGRFPNFYVVDEAAYKRKKHEALVKRESDVDQELVKREVTEQLFAHMQSIESLTHQQRANVLGMSLSNYYFHLRKFNSKSTTEV